MAMKHDLMFLELLLGMIIKHRDEGEEECDKWISAILYNQNGPKYFIHRKAADLCNQVNPALSQAILEGYENMKSNPEIESPIGVLEETLVGQITKVRGIPRDEIYKSLKRDFAIAELFANGIHIDAP
jgi:hypothetical protein